MQHAFCEMEEWQTESLKQSPRYTVNINFPRRLILVEDNLFSRPAAAGDENRISFYRQLRVPVRSVHADVIPVFKDQ